MTSQNSVKAGGLSCQMLFSLSMLVQIKKRRVHSLEFRCGKRNSRLLVLLATQLFVEFLYLQFGVTYITDSTLRIVRAGAHACGV